MEKLIVFTFWINDQYSNTLPIFYLSNEIIDAIEGKTMMLKLFDEDFWTSDNIPEFERLNIIEESLVEILEDSTECHITLFIIQECFRDKIISLIKGLEEAFESESTEDDLVDIEVLYEYNIKYDSLFFLEAGKDGVLTLKLVTDPPQKKPINIDINLN